MTVASTPGGLNLNTLTFGGGGTQGSSSALGNLSAITSSEWQTYLQHYVPYENMLIQYAMDPNLAQQNMQTAMQQVTQSETQGLGIAQRRLAQQDVSLSAEEKSTAGRTTNITNALAKVNAANQAKDFTVQQQMGIMGAPMAGV